MTGHPQNFRDLGKSISSLLGETKPSEASVAPAFGAILRCGAIDGFSWSALGCPRSVINLRASPDDAWFLQQATLAPKGSSDAVSALAAAERFNSSFIVDLYNQHGVFMIHEATEDKTERYFTGELDVRKWICAVLKRFEDPSILPCVIHCRAGRDRTGIICAALLCCLGCPPELILKEYQLSDEPKTELFIKALIGFGLDCEGLSERGVEVDVKRNGSKQPKWKRNVPSCDPAEMMEKYVRGTVNLAKVRQNLLLYRPYT